MSLTNVGRRTGFRAPLARGAGLVLIAVSGLSALPHALAFELALPILDLTGTLQSQISTGVTVRTENRSNDLIGKTNLPGQQNFCEDDLIGMGPGVNCTKAAGNAAFLKLPGANTVNNDNGDLNYNKGDVVASSFRYAPRLQLTHPLFGIDVSAVAYYDPVNYRFTEYHPNNTQDNNGFQPRNTPRNKAAAREIGLGVQLLDAFVSAQLPLPGERQLSVKLGNQLLSLGTTTTLVLNGLNTVNPPDVNLRNVPGSDLRDVFRRVPLAVLSTNLTDSFAVLGFYQFQWRPVTIPPIGSYYSTADFLGRGDPYVELLFGKMREDPNNLAGAAGRTPGNAKLLSKAGRTLYFEPARTPGNDGQFGFNLNYVAEWLGGTSFDLTYLNLHSRVPTVNFRASQYGCASNSTNAVEATLNCQGFATTPAGKELLPLDTVKLFLDYPRNIHALGLSFSTNLGTVSWTGEAVYRPNQPLQIDAIDLGFAALQPTFPANDISLGVVAIPGRRVATPDYVETVYRHNPQVQPGQVIRGYERFQTLAYNTSFLLLLGASDNPFHADQLTLLTELGAYQVFGLPSLDELQIAAPGTQFHHSAGIDSTGTPNAQQASSSPDNRLNPSYQASGFATSFSAGYRVLGALTYENVLPRVRVSPQVSFFHDVVGRSPQPTGEFVEGRIQTSLGVNAVVRERFSATLRYTWYLGAGRANLLNDRDNVQVGLSYDF